jgi:hypothetical protein
VKKPAVVVGARDLTNVYDHASYFLCTAKTLNPPVSGPPTGPIYRVHLSIGTEDNTLLGEGRHEGLCGGLQVLVRLMYPQVGDAPGTGRLHLGRHLPPAGNSAHLQGRHLSARTWIGANYTFNWGK